MKVNWKKTVASALVAAGLLAPGTASAAIPLGDANFDTYDVTPHGGLAYASSTPPYTGIYRPTSAWIDDPDSPPGYAEDSGRSNWIYDAAYAAGGPQASPGGADDQAMHGRASYSGQIAPAVFEAGKTYTFSVLAQGDSNTFGDESRIWLYMYDASGPFLGNTSLVAQKFSVFTGDFHNRGMWSDAQSQARWKRISISHTVEVGAPEIGNPIGVVFWAGFDAGVDSALLQVPEPSSAILVGMSGLTLLGTRRRK